MGEREKGEEDGMERGIERRKGGTEARDKNEKEKEMQGGRKERRRKRER